MGATLSTHVSGKSCQKLTSLTLGRFLALQPCDEVGVNGMLRIQQVSGFHFVFSVLLFLTPSLYLCIGICQHISTVLFYISFGMAFATVQISCQTFYPPAGCSLAPHQGGGPRRTPPVGGALPPISYIST
jgi:hypothetical protein